VLHLQLERAVATQDDDLRDLIRQHGLRVTTSRVAVLRSLRGQPGPASHPEITAALDGNGWDRSTLYRNLVDLAEAGILRRVDVGDHVWRYELASVEFTGKEAAHPHFLCTTCGDVSCLPDIPWPRLGGAVPQSVSRGEVTIQLRGVCDHCATT
jgi:Fur family ferric uptake transcriptional regulator